MTVATATRAATNFHEVLNLVKSAGLLKKKPSFYIIRLSVISAIATGLWVAGGFIGGAVQTHWAWIFAAFGIAGLLGIMSAQYGFIAHEAAHRQIFQNNKANDALGLVLANLFAGLSYGFWLRKHNKHHQHPNQIGQDPDIAIRILSFTPESRDQKRGIERWISERQGYFFPFLLLLTGFDLLLDSIANLRRKDRPIGTRLLEFSLMIVRQTSPYLLMTWMFGWLWAIALWVFMMMVFGFFMGAAFAPNHKGMPLVPKDAKIDFFERQVLTSRNIKGSWLKDNLMGGLNYQVEHHLFPSMPRPNLIKANAIVKKFCEEKGVTLVEMNLMASYKVIIDYLSKVGLSNNADPFVCPMVATLRPRS
ncbi:fatty acid desaturase family protein [Rhodoluna limnophila]|uniref:fatty acid desaturase family protein n=1 Tax=Rhodoluna limnophila TaxID=232537 RepID=UPI0011064FCE|nr:acyl-CoA desaturase [Rhodoluna limnophila]